MAELLGRVTAQLGTLGERVGGSGAHRRDRLDRVRYWPE